MEAKMARRGTVLLACLFLASGILVDSQLVTGVYDISDIRNIDLSKVAFNLTCNLAESVPANTPVDWFKDDKPVSNTTLKERSSWLTKERVAVLTIKPVNEDDHGSYSCRLQDDPTAYANFRVYGKPYVHLPPNHNVVEEQKIKMICAVHGKPYPEISWMYNNGSGNVTLTASEGARITFDKNEAGVENAMLVLTAAQPSDAGSYYCVANQLDTQLKHIDGTVLRVKDKYAALWPFIGICAEVIVLCAVILVYEKRRSKNGDMEDSDTDNHDQKKS